MLGDAAADGGPQFNYAGGGAALQTAAHETGEEASDRVEPGG